MSGWGAPAPHNPSSFRRPLGLPKRKNGTAPIPRDIENHEFSGFGHFARRNQKSPGSKNIRDTFPVISVTSILHQLPYRAKQKLGGVENRDFVPKIIGSLLDPKGDLSGGVFSLRHPAHGWWPWVTTTLKT